MKIRTDISRKRLMYRHLSRLKLFKKDVFPNTQKRDVFRQIAVVFLCSTTIAFRKLNF